MTALGRVFVGVMLVGLGGGYGLGWVELRIAGYAALIAVCVSLLFLLPNRGAQVSLLVPERVTVAGSSASVIVRVATAARVRLAPRDVELSVDGRLEVIRVAALGAGSSTDVKRVIPAERRGVLVVGPVRLVRRDPLGLFRRSEGESEQIEILVHPLIASIPAQSTGLIRDLEGSPTRDLTSSDISFHALREYVPGDDRRYIHWKSTAKTGTHMVRQFEETRRSHIMIVQSLSAADYASPDEFELAASAVGSLGVRAIRDARTVSVITGRGADRPGTRLRQGRGRTGGTRDEETTALAIRSPTTLLDDLSRITLRDGPSQLVAVSRGAAERVQGVSVAFLVCGSQIPARVLRAAANMFPVGVEVLVVVCEPRALPGLTKIGELRVLRIGRLDDLAAGLRRAVSNA